MFMRMTMEKAEQQALRKWLSENLPDKFRRKDSDAPAAEPVAPEVLEMQKNRMLRLFGIAEADGAELYVSDHAKS